eukprot:s5489_g3.t1
MPQDGSADSCQRFESNIFRRERCKHCGQQWHAHNEGAIDATQLATFRRQEDVKKASASAASAAASSQEKAKPRKVESRGEWLYDDPVQEDEACSDSGDEGFRMFAGQEGSRLWHAAAQEEEETQAAGSELGAAALAAPVLIEEERKEEEKKEERGKEKGEEKKEAVPEPKEPPRRKKEAVPEPKYLPKKKRD